MTIINMLIVFLLIILIIFFINKNRVNFNVISHFLNNSCNKKICYDSLKKCTSTNGYIYDDSKKDSVIDRKTYK